MDATTFILLTLAVAMAWVTFSAWRQGNDKRDVVLLGTLGGMCGAGAAAAALF